MSIVRFGSILILIDVLFSVAGDVTPLVRTVTSGLVLGIAVRVGLVFRASVSRWLKRSMVLSIGVALSEYVAKSRDLAPIYISRLRWQPCLHHTRWGVRH